jgi:putative aldouronate transport system permease protein
MIDGANRGQNIWYITLPSLLPTISIMLLLSVGKIFYGDFGMVYSIVRDNSVLFPATDVIDVYVYRLLRKSGDMSQAMAAGLYQAALGFVMIWCTNKIVKKLYPEGSLF